MAGLLPLLLLPILMYFLLIRPQQRKMRAQQDLLSHVSENDEVMTTAGIYGYVNAIEGDTVWLEIAEGVEVRITKAAIARRVDPGTAGDKAADKAPEVPAEAPDDTPARAEIPPKAETPPRNEA
jgi:preprotein translocase subunit YajC